MTLLSTAMLPLCTVHFQGIPIYLVTLLIEGLCNSLFINWTWSNLGVYHCLEESPTSARETCWWKIQPMVLPYYTILRLDYDPIRRNWVPAHYIWWPPVFTVTAFCYCKETRIAPSKAHDTRTGDHRHYWGANQFCNPTCFMTFRNPCHSVKFSCIPLFVLIIHWFEKCSKGM